MSSSVVDFRGSLVSPSVAFPSFGKVCCFSFLFMFDPLFLFVLFCFSLLVFGLLWSIYLFLFCSVQTVCCCSVSVRFPLFPARSCFLFFLFSFLLSSVVSLYFVFLFLCVSLCLCVCIGSENGVALVLGLLLGGGGGCWLQRWLRR